MDGTSFINQQEEGIKFNKQKNQPENKAKL